MRGVGVESKMGKRDVCEGGKMCWGRGPWSVGHKHARAHAHTHTVGVRVCVCGGGGGIKCMLCATLF